MRTLLAFVFGRKCDDGSERVEIVGKMNRAGELVPADNPQTKRSTTSTRDHSKPKLNLPLLLWWALSVCGKLPRTLSSQRVPR